jgi:heterodisulfide reductase subunit A-like polyferredoxin
MKSKFIQFALLCLVLVACTGMNVSTTFTGEFIDYEVKRCLNADKGCLHKDHKKYGSHMIYWVDIRKPGELIERRYQATREAFDSMYLDRKYRFQAWHGFCIYHAEEIRD